MNIPLTLIFLIDFLYRMKTAPSRSYYFWRNWGWADLLASLPFEQTKILRVFRLVKVYRLLQEYGVKTTVDVLPYECACWPQGSVEALARVRWPSFGFCLVRDYQDRLVCLFRSRWDRDHFTPDYPDIVWNDMG